MNKYKKKKLQKKREKEGKIKCCSCSNEFYKDELNYGPDPYSSEINGNYENVYLCDVCYHNSCMDI